MNLAIRYCSFLSFRSELPRIFHFLFMKWLPNPFQVVSVRLLYSLLVMTARNSRNRVLNPESSRFLHFRSFYEVCWILQQDEYFVSSLFFVVILRRYLQENPLCPVDIENLKLQTTATIFTDISLPNSKYKYFLTTSAFLDSIAKENETKIQGPVVLVFFTLAATNSHVTFRVTVVVFQVIFFRQLYSKYFASSK